MSTKDGRQYYTVPVGYSDFHIHSRYKNLKMIGDGSFGLVASALDMKSGKKVAIKKVQLNCVDIKCVLREVKLLAHFNTHENIISLYDLMSPTHRKDQFDDIYIVTSFMDRDLSRVIASKQSLSEQHIQYILFQIFRGLKFLHSANVLHRDLKPSNVLINTNCAVALCDLGLSRGINASCDDLTEYVVTRWYRPPELLLHCATYGKPVDVWSVGCIFAELVLRKVFFRGDTPQHQLRVIVEKIGLPSAENLHFIDSIEGMKEIRSLPTPSTVSLSAFFPPHVHPLSVVLLGRMLQFNPAERVTVEEALAQPYLQEFHAHWSEPVCPKMFDFDFERPVVCSSTSGDAVSTSEGDSESGASGSVGSGSNKATLTDKQARRLLYAEVCKYNTPLPLSDKEGGASIDTGSTSVDNSGSVDSGTSVDNSTSVGTTGTSIATCTTTSGTSAGTAYSTAHTTHRKTISNSTSGDGVSVLVGKSSSTEEDLGYLSEDLKDENMQFQLD